MLYFNYCITDRNDQDNLEIVAAGGSSSESFLDLVEIYNPTTLTKRLAPTLTFNQLLISTAHVQFSDHFIILGGWLWNGDYTGEIYKFDPSTETFVLLPQSVTPRDNSAAIAIPDSMTTCT